jgi:SAM-dependent methyltransferase
MDLKEKFDKFENWITKFEIDGISYGGWYSAGAADEPRLTQFFTLFPHCKKILELGSFEGGQTVVLSSNADVVGVEGRQSNIDKSEFIKSIVCPNKNVRFVCEDLEEYDLTKLGTFDVVFCVGLLYHIVEPWLLLDKIRKVSNNLFLWTHYCADEDVNVSIQGYEGFVMFEPIGLDQKENSTDGLSINAYRPTLSSLTDMIMDSGFDDFNIIYDQSDHIHGPAVTISAKASS